MSAARKIEPRLLTLEQAADYLTMPVAGLRKLGIGRVCLGTRVRYDRFALDAYVDAQRADQPLSIIPYEDDAEAAFDRSVADQRHAARSA